VRSLIAIALFLLGTYVSIRTIAALYRVIDLWYTIRTEYAKVLRGLLVWCGGTVAIAALLPDRHRPPFLWGLAVYLGFYLGGFFLWHLMVRVIVSRNIEE
jgi:hypothetical protein